ncbi:MAG: hypothetical protein K2K83_02125 [Rikenella sp.]|nr:hypothetical protein [Rikenella sp.]
MKRIMLSLLLLTGSWAAAQAQSEKPAFKTRFSVGANFSPEWAMNEDRGQFFPTFGVAFEAQFTRRSGIEVGIYDRSQRETWTHYIPIETKILNYPPDQYMPIKRSERGHWLSVRGGYKLATEFLDVGVGLLYDFRLGEEGRDADLIGPYLTLSRNITLYKGLLLELRAQVNPVFRIQSWRSGYVGTFVGPGIGLKYRF